MKFSIIIGTVFLSLLGNAQVVNAHSDPSAKGGGEAPLKVTSRAIDNMTDQDGDGVVDSADNCIEVANPAQRDSNGDGYGNYCDADLDGNLRINMADFILLRNKLGSQDPDADLNGDGIVNVVDFILLRNRLNTVPGPSCCISVQTISSGQMSISFETIASGLEVSSLKNGATELLNTTAQNELFSLFITNTATNASESITSSENWENTVITLSNNNSESSITFSNPTQNGLPSTLVATVTVKTIGSKSEWDLSVTGLGNNHSLIDVNFPHFNIKAEGEDQFLIPRFTGQLIYNPGAGIDYRGLYPRGSASTMQFLAYYNNNYGIYFGFHDPDAALKTFRVVDEEGGIKMEGQFPIPDKQIAGNDWEMPGHFELDLFNGNWFEAAQIYKSWASTSANYWPQSSPERDARQNVIGRLGVWGTLQEEHSLTVDIQRRMQLFIDYFPGVPVGMHWYQWNNLPQDDDFPNYFPEKTGAIALIENLQSNNDVVIMPYVNGRLWDISLVGGEFDFDANALPFATKISINDDAYFSQPFRGNTFAVMCPTQAPWQDLMVDISDQITNRMGAHGVYLDQVANASARECMDPDHNHPLGGGTLWRDGYNEMLEKIHTQISSGKIVTVEGGTDFIVDKVDGFLTDSWKDPNLVPAFPAVYAGKVQLFGTRAATGLYNDPAFYSIFAQSFSQGIQPGRFNYPIAFSQSAAATAAPFVRQIATMRYKLRDFMSFGEMHKPLLVIGNNPDITSVWKLLPNRPNPPIPVNVTISTIQSSIWQSKDGRIAVVFVNASMTDNMDFSFNFDSSQYGLNGQLQIREVTENSDGIFVAINSAFTQNVSLPAMGVRAYIITP